MVTREYILEIAKALAETRRQRDAKRAERDKWKDRLSLADKAGKTDLAEAARQQEERLNQELAPLERETRELEGQIRQWKKDLKAADKAPRFSVDAAQVLAGMEELTGPSEFTALEREARENQANADLAALKREMGEESPSQ